MLFRVTSCHSINLGNRKGEARVASCRHNNLSPYAHHPLGFITGRFKHNSQENVRLNQSCRALWTVGIRGHSLYAPTWSPSTLSFPLSLPVCPSLCLCPPPVTSTLCPRHTYGEVGGVGCLWTAIVTGGPGEGDRPPP